MGSNPKGVIYSHRGAYLNSLATVLLNEMKSMPVYLWCVPMFHCNGWCQRSSVSYKDRNERVVLLKSERIKMDSLEEKVFMFIDEEYYSNESELDEDLWWQDNAHSHGSPDNTLHWESQVSLLQETLERYHVGGSKLRGEVGRIIQEVKGSDFCSCLKGKPLDCSSCLRREVVTELRDRGFSTKLCISKWGTTKKFPGGCHEYIQVIAKTSTRKKQIHILIELELREQFQIAKAGENYQHLVSCLLEFYIGKADNLIAIVRVMCNAAKKSMEED